MIMINLGLKRFGAAKGRIDGLFVLDAVMQKERGSPFLPTKKRPETRTRVYIRWCKLNLVHLFLVTLVVIWHVFNTATNTNQQFIANRCFFYRNAYYLGSHLISGFTLESKITTSRVFTVLIIIVDWECYWIGFQNKFASSELGYMFKMTEIKVLQDDPITPDN